MGFYCKSHKNVSRCANNSEGTETHVQTSSTKAGGIWQCYYMLSSSSLLYTAENTSQAATVKTLA